MNTNIIAISPNQVGTLIVTADDRPVDLMIHLDDEAEERSFDGTLDPGTYVVLDFIPEDPQVGILTGSIVIQLGTVHGLSLVGEVDPAEFIISQVPSASGATEVPAWTVFPHPTWDRWQPKDPDTPVVDLQVAGLKMVRGKSWDGLRTWRLDFQEADEFGNPASWEVTFDGKFTAWGEPEGGSLGWFQTQEKATDAIIEFENGLHRHNLRLRNGGQA